MKALEQAVDEILPVGAPIVQVRVDEPVCRQGGAPIFAAGQPPSILKEVVGKFVEQGFVEGTELSVRRRPVLPRVCEASAWAR